ncbi:MAG UNVERIFIED_CONTAM: hypothetical protein LVR18_27255 [Planctomycetaceae bacterium]|jgi:hypothetical protein
MAAGQGVIDVDASYDAASGLTLDEHRQIELAKIQQPGFGQQPATTQDTTQQAE